MARDEASPPPDTLDTLMTLDPSEDESTAATTPVPENPDPYRESRELPRQVKTFTQIYSEEQLYHGSLKLLQVIASSGTRRRHPSENPVMVPPTSQLALFTTLLVHPLHTTRAETQQKFNIPILALRYLRTILVKVGPVNADFKTAFQFHPGPRFVRRYGQSAPPNESESEEETAIDDERIKGSIPNEGSLWSLGQDFWNTVGWAFNCSARHPKRWYFWKIWLEFMVDVLQADWDERARLDEKLYQENDQRGKMPSKWREESIMFMYMNQLDGRTRSLNDIMKALFADGGDLFTNNFREVFGGELRGPRKEKDYFSKKRKRDDFLDIDNGQFGDYFDDESSMSSGTSEPPTPTKSRNSRKFDSDGVREAGLAETLDCRFRLFKLYSLVAYDLQPRSLSDVYSRYTSAFKLLPMETFALFVRGMGKSDNSLIFASRITVVRELFNLLVPSSSKDPYKVDRATCEVGGLSSSMLEHCYILHPANTVAIEDNAKLSLVVEAALQLMIEGELIEYSPSFAAAAEKGITAREKKVKTKKAGKMRADPMYDLAHEVLVNSGERIRLLLYIMAFDEDLEDEDDEDDEEEEEGEDEEEDEEEEDEEEEDEEEEDEEEDDDEDDEDEDGEDEDEDEDMEY